MLTKVVGIVGNGTAMQHFLSMTTVYNQKPTSETKHNQETKQDQKNQNKNDNPSTSLDLVTRKESIFTGLDKIIFFNHSHHSNEEYITDNWSPTCQQLNSKGIQYNIINNFEQLIASCDVIVDASRGYRFPSLLESAKKLKNGADPKTTNPPSNSITTDYQEYYTKKNPNNHKIMSKEIFQERWNLSYKIMMTAAEVNKKIPIGWRIIDDLPFNVPIFIEKGLQLTNAIKTGINLPTYINLANEPCLTSAVIVSHCPEMTPYVVACTGFDRERLQRIFEDEPAYQGIMERCGITPKEVLVSLRGFHDEKVMIPIITSPYNGTAVEKLIEAGLSYKRVYTHLKQEVGTYWNNYNLSEGTREHRDVNEEVDNSLLDLVTSALQSRGKALSLYPSREYRPLCNGYFHQLHDNGKGLFLIGDHRFRNGKVTANE